MGEIRRIILYRLENGKIAGELVYSRSMENSVREYHKDNIIGSIDVEYATNIIKLEKIDKNDKNLLQKIEKCDIIKYYGSLKEVPNSNGLILIRYGSCCYGEV